jgi:hypothetical protein
LLGSCNLQSINPKNQPLFDSHHSVIPGKKQGFVIFVTKNPALWQYACHLSCVILIKIKIIAHAISRIRYYRREIWRSDPDHSPTKQLPLLYPELVDMNL